MAVYTDGADYCDPTREYRMAVYTDGADYCDPTREYRMAVYTDGADSDDSSEVEVEVEATLEGGEEEVAETVVGNVNVGVEVSPSGGAVKSFAEECQLELGAVKSFAEECQLELGAVKSFAEECQLELVLKSMKDTNAAYGSTVSALETGLSQAPENHKKDWLEDIAAAKSDRVAAVAKSMAARVDLERGMKVRGMSMVVVRDHPDYKQYVKLIEVGASLSLVKEKLIVSGTLLLI